MLEIFRQVIANQFEAALCTLNACVDACPESIWNGRVGNHKFCQVAFHTLFYADYYLGQNEESFREQPFHRDNQGFFGDYEEFLDRAPRALYGKEPMKNYLQHCRAKAKQTIDAETADSFSARAGFQRRECSRAELYVYTIRHIQHHAAQLSLRLRLDIDEDVPWVGSGWRA